MLKQKTGKYKICYEYLIVNEHAFHWFFFSFVNYQSIFYQILFYLIVITKVNIIVFTFVLDNLNNFLLFLGF